MSPSACRSAPSEVLNTGGLQCTASIVCPRTQPFQHACSTGSLVWGMLQQPGSCVLLVQSSDCNHFRHNRMLPKPFEEGPPRCTSYAKQCKVSDSMRTMTGAQADFVPYSAGSALNIRYDSWGWMAHSQAYMTVGTTAADMLSDKWAPTIVRSAASGACI